MTIAILGATGRTGRGIARALSEAGNSIVLVGRDRARLDALAEELGDAVVVAGPIETAVAELTALGPEVVVNTIGPFERTSPLVLDAVPAAHHLDLANDPVAARLVLDRDEAARAAGRTLVTGAGFGVLGAESVALRVRGDGVAPVRVRVDSMATVGSPGGGTLGEALAATIVEGFASLGRVPARERRGWPRVGTRREAVVTPDGDELATVGFPSGEWIAAVRATGAPSVFAASSAVPSSRLVPIVLPVAMLALRSARLRASLIRRLARTAVSSNVATRASWARARAEWSDGTVRTQWLRAGDGMDFTVAVAAEIAMRLARGEGRPGAFTPGALFGAELAVAAGGEFIAEGAIGPAS